MIIFQDELQRWWETNIRNRRMGNLVDGKIRGMRKARNRERLPTTKNCQSAPNMEEHGAPARKDGGEDKS